MKKFLKQTGIVLLTICIVVPALFGAWHVSRWVNWTYGYSHDFQERLDAHIQRLKDVREEVAELRAQVEALERSMKDSR